MSSRAGSSLLDDPRIDDLDRGLASSRPAGTRREFPSTPLAPPVSFAPVDAPADSGSLWEFPYLAVWLSLMALGAAGAAFLFSDRLLQLISR